MAAAYSSLRGLHQSLIHSWPSSSHTSCSSSPFACILKNPRRRQQQQQHQHHQACCSCISISLSNPTLNPSLQSCSPCSSFVIKPRRQRHACSSSCRSVTGMSCSMSNLAVKPRLQVCSSCSSFVNSILKPWREQQVCLPSCASFTCISSSVLNPGVNPRLKLSSVAARWGGIATGSRSWGNSLEWPAAAMGCNTAGLDSWFENESNVSAQEGLNVLPARDFHYKEAVEALERSQVIAVPTDTLYGLACDACSADAIQRIYEIKARKLSSPLAVCVADVEDVSSYSDTSHLPFGLLGELLPGPVTLLLPRGESTLLSPSLNPGVASIGIRIPDSEFIRGISRSFGGALALTSANISSHLSTIRVEEFEHLWPQCGYVFNAGVLPSGRSGSTIVDITQKGSYKVIRSGNELQETIQILEKFGLRGV